MLLSDISPKFTEEVLVDIIRKCGGKTLKNWSLGGGFKRGDSYLSEVNRLKIVGLDENNGEVEISVVIKALPKSKARCLTFGSQKYFAREHLFYTTIWSAFEAFQTKYTIPNPFRGIPRCLAFYVDGVNDFVVMEDLCVDGYRPGDRTKGLDVETCRLAIESLGTLHAFSMAMKHLEPKVWSEISANCPDIYHAESNREWYKEMAVLQIMVARDAVHHEYPDSEIERKAIEFTEPDFYTKMVTLSHTLNKYSVINHGDCWLPNFLFAYDDKNECPKSAKMIDFQLARLSSPALDISFFIYSCTTEEMRKDHYDFLLKSYHSSVVRLLKQFELDPQEVFPMSALEQEMREFARFGVGMGMEAVPLSIVDEIADLDLIEGEEPMKLTEVWPLKKIQDKEGRRRLADIFKHAVQYNYL